MASGSRPPELQAIFDDLEQAGPFDSIDDVNRVLSARLHEHNTRPHAELGGLSPDEMIELLYGDWDARGALRLNETISADDLAGAALLADARTLLQYVATNGPVKETAARNLPRAVVAVLLPLLRTPWQGLRATAPAEPTPLNEGDVRWLPELRHTLMFAGLLTRRKGLRVTSRGQELLLPGRAGALYALLFRTLFRKLDLRVFDRSDRHLGLQSTIAWSFYKLRTAARGWTSSQVLAEDAWLASAKDPPSDWEHTYGDFRHHSFRHRVLTPLAGFGLLQERSLPGKEPWLETVEFRCSPLYDRFLRFEFAGRAAADMPSMP